MLNITEMQQKLTPIEVSKLRDVGDLLQYFISWSALIIVALNGDQAAAWRWLYIGVLVAVITHLLKYLFDFTKLGTRPDGGRGSMPSGHTSAAFMGAFFYYFQFGLGASILPLILAAVTGYSRIFAQRHWPRDVVGGALLALLFNYLFFYVLEAKPLF